jgi:hypothetical protein
VEEGDVVDAAADVREEPSPICRNRRVGGISSGLDDAAFV